LVERINKDLKICIKAYAEDHADWDKQLHAIIFAIRTRQSMATRFCPSELSDGIILRHPAEARIENKKEVGENRSTVKYKWQLQEATEEKITAARKNLVAANEKTAALYNKDRRQHNMQEDSTVMRRTNILSNAANQVAHSLTPSYHGPYRLVQQLGPNSFKLQTASGDDAGQRNTDQLKLYNVQPPWAVTRGSTQDKLMKMSNAKVLSKRVAVTNAESLCCRCNLNSATMKESDKSGEGSGEDSAEESPELKAGASAYSLEPGTSPPSKRPRKGTPHKLSLSQTLQAAKQADKKVKEDPNEPEASTSKGQEGEQPKKQTRITKIKFDQQWGYCRFPVVWKGRNPTKTKSEERKKPPVIRLQGVTAKLINERIMGNFTLLMKWQDKFVYNLIHEREGGPWIPPPPYNSKRRAIEGLMELYERANLKLGTCMPGACRGDTNPKKQHFKRRCCMCGGARCVSEHNMTYGFTAQVCLKKMRATIKAMRKAAQEAQEAGEKLTTTSPEPEEPNSGGSSEADIKELLEYTLSTDEEDSAAETPREEEKQASAETTLLAETIQTPAKAVPSQRSAEQVERERRILQEYIGLGETDRGLYMAQGSTNVFVVAHGRAEGQDPKEKKDKESESSSDSSDASSTSISSASEDGDVSPCDHNNCDGWRKAIRYKKELKGIKQETAHLHRKLGK